MPDFNVDWQDDFHLTPDGDLMMIDFIPLDNQLLERRLLTAVQGYIAHPTYAAGLPQRIGRVARGRDIATIVRAQCALEASVASIPAPVITVTFDPAVVGACVILIVYTNAISGTIVNLSLEVPGNR